METLKSLNEAFYKYTIVGYSKRDQAWSRAVPYSYIQYEDAARTAALLTREHQEPFEVILEDDLSNYVGKQRSN